MVDTLTSYRMITSNMTRSLTRVSKEPLVERETAYYKENIGKVKSIDDFMKDDRLYRYAMKAYGLEDMAYAKAFIRKILTEGVKDDNSMANTLVDKRYKEFATAFDFAALGDKTTAQDVVKTGVPDKYVRQTLEEEAGDQNEGVRLALYFARKAPTITSAYEILGDKALLQVAQTALGIPPETSRADIDKQAKMIEERLDIESLSDPEELEKFLTRFTAMHEMKNPSQGSASSIASLLLGGTSSVGISTSILTTLQSFRPGGR
jgi:hypothetical protein